MKATAIGAVVLSGLWLGACAGCMGMQKASAMDSAPAAVKTAVATAVGGNKVEKFEKEEEDGKTVYEASFDVNGVEHTVTFDEAGAVIEEESEVKVADLPPAVSAAVLKTQPLAHVKEAAKVKKGDTSYLEVDVAVGKDKHELLIATDGALMSDKVEADEEGEKDGEKEHKGGKHEEHEGNGKRSDDKD